MELHFTDHAQLKKMGRTFTCNGCPIPTQKLRRCREDRWDFTAADSNIFPIRISEGSGLYGFCPAKVTWDQEAISLFELMIVAVEQKVMLSAGGLGDQPSWFVSFLAWFGPAYDTQKFVSRAKMILGDGKESTNKTAPLKRGKK